MNLYESATNVKRDIYILSISIDPEGNETEVLFELYPDWGGKSVLEIGSGDGRLTWRYIDKVSHVTAIEPDAEKHKAAVANCPRRLRGIKFINQDLDGFYRQVNLPAPTYPAKGRRSKELSHQASMPLRSLRSLTTPRSLYGSAIRGEKFDLAILSWSL